MAELIVGENELHDEFDEKVSHTLKQTLSKKLPRTFSARPSDGVTTRWGASAEVCGTMYRTYTTEDDVPATSEPLSAAAEERRRSQEKRKLIIIMVGLPGRGKTYLCNKLMCYLNWLGHKCRHFNVGAYRRKIKATDDPGEQDASFFDHANEEGMRARQKALENALENMLAWLRESNDNQVAIFDATNSTEERRNYLREKFHGKFQYLLIESICNDQETLEKNYLLKMKYSPDYKGKNVEEALEDFRARIREYEKVYVPLTDGHSNRHLHFIQLNNMVTGRGYMDINRISGYIPGKIVFFLMQVCRSGLTNERKIWLTRHGESEFNRLAKIGGDAGLTDKGLRYRNTLARALISLVPVNDEQGHNEDEVMIPMSVWTSTLKRTIQTAKNVPFPQLRWKALDEIHAGICDGMTYEEIKQAHPDVYAGRKADKLTFRYPSGESYLDVIKRLEPIIIEVEREMESVCIVGHQAILRVLYGYFMKVDIHELPELEMPLHTLIELTPMPDGTMIEKRYKINIDSETEDDLFDSITYKASPGSPGSAANSLFAHYTQRGGAAPPAPDRTGYEYADMHFFPNASLPKPMASDTLPDEPSSPTARREDSGSLSPSKAEGRGTSRLKQMTRAEGSHDKQGKASELTKLCTRMASVSSCASPMDL